MTIEVRHEDFSRLIDLQSVLEQVATGFDFLEGPVWHPSYDSIIFSDILGNSIYSWRADVGIVKRNHHSYMANGNAFDQNGRLLTCEHATSRLSRTELSSGKYEVLASHYRGRELNSPNDVIVSSNGRIYFTDPTSGRSAEYGILRKPELSYSGIYQLDPTNGELTLLIDDFAKPNGLCFSMDESLLYISDTERQHIRVFEVMADGGLGNDRLFANLIGSKPGVADGLKIDSEGNVYAAGPGGIHVFTAGGNCLGVVETPEAATNFVFGDDDFCSLYITATTSLYRLRVKVPGVATFQPELS